MAMQEIEPGASRLSVQAEKFIARAVQRPHSLYLTCSACENWLWAERVWTKRQRVVTTCAQCSRDRRSQVWTFWPLPQSPPRARSRSRSPPWTAPTPPSTTAQRQRPLQQQVQTRLGEEMRQGDLVRALGWQLVESRRQPGRFYWNHPETGQTSIEPPMAVARTRPEECRYPRVQVQQVAQAQGSQVVQQANMENRPSTSSSSTDLLTEFVRFLGSR